MARITGVQGGLLSVQSVVEETKKRKAAASKKKPPARLHDNEYDCEACGARVVEKQSKTDYRSLRAGLCLHCCRFFGTGYSMTGCTNASPVAALQALSDLREQGFLLALRDLHLGAPDGHQIEIDAGDIFACKPSNPDRQEGGEESKDRTWQLFMLNVQIGPYSVRLFPHEWSPISLTRVMEFKKAGEIVEGYLCQEDNNGHFQPTPALREQIVGCFGRMIGAR